MEQSVGQEVSEETIQAAVMEQEHEELPADATGKQQDTIIIKEQEQPTQNDVEMVSVEAPPMESVIPSSEEKKEIEAPEKEEEPEMSKYQVIDEVTNALDQVSAPIVDGGGGAVIENGNMDSLKESTPVPQQEAAINNNGHQMLNGGGVEVKTMPDATQETDDSKPPAEEEDRKMPATEEDSKPPAAAAAAASTLPKQEGDSSAETNGGGVVAVDASGAASLPPQATTATESEIKDATAETLVVLKAGPDGQTIAVMPPLQPSKHVKKGEVLKRPQNVTSVVTRNGKTWNEMFDALVAYKAEHGDCYVPDRFKNKEGVCLGLWVRNQRRREESLTEEQHKRLTELGLDWQTQNERFDNVWHERYAKLTMYRVEHGDCKVPYTYKADPALAKWVSQQRAQQAQGRLAPDRKAKLDAIDFSWKLNTVKNRNTKTEDKKWMRQYEKLVAFHEANGHCKVPDRYKPDRPLGTWVKKQRLANACNQLKEDRKKMLDDLGFVWRITDKTDGEKWDKMFTKLKEYKEENGTCHVSRTVPDSDLKPLARWVKTQRALYKSGKILPDRKERLETIDFVWDGTQLPIKRKRRRPTDEGEVATHTHAMKIEMPMPLPMPMPPIKRARTEETDVEMKASVEDGKVMPEKKMAAKRVLPIASQKADATFYTRADSEEVKGAAALKEMVDSASAVQGKPSTVVNDESGNNMAAEDKDTNGKVQANTDDKSNEASSLAQPTASRNAGEGKPTTAEDNATQEEKTSPSTKPEQGDKPNEVEGQAPTEKAGGDSTEEEDDEEAHEEETVLI